MATVDFAGLNPALASFFADRISGQINRSVTLAQILPVKLDRGQGKNVQFIAKFGTSTGAAVADGANVSTFNNDSKVPGVLQYAIYSDAFKVTGLARAAAAAAGNPAQLADIYMDEMGDSVERLAKIVSQHLWTGNAGASPAQVAGLLAASNAALGATGTYAGIARGTYAQWASNSIDVTTVLAGGDPLGSVPGYDNNKLIIVALRKLRTAITIASGKMPDVVVMGPALFEKFALAGQQNRRWVDQVRLNGGMIKLDYGLNALDFDGMPVIEDVDCPAGSAVMLNTKEMYIQQLPDSADAVNGALGMAQLAGTPDQINRLDGRTRLSARVQPLAINGDAFPFALYCYLQLVVLQPNCMGQLNGFV
jgi:hypothetical protein